MNHPPSPRPGSAPAAATLLALALLALLPACEGVLGIGGDRLDEARDRWRSGRPASYRFTFRRVCFCPGTDPVVVTVEGDSVIDVHPAPGSERVEATRARVRTVDGLFDLLREWQARDPHSESTTYHEALGYPTEAFFDFRADVADEEQGFEVSNLNPWERLE